MKYIIILGDGMADDPATCPDRITPMMAAHKPNIDELAKKGKTGLLTTVPKNLPAGSEIANMSILGYDPEKCYEGRGVLEAASMNIPIQDNELVMRCNLICIEKNNIKNHSAGHITTEEAKELIHHLNQNLGSTAIKFHPGISYRHLIILKNQSKDIDLTPPHDVPGTQAETVMPKPTTDQGKQTAEQIEQLIRASWTLLATHPINIKRTQQGKDPANSIWPWSQGYKPDMENFQKTHNIKVAVISAVDLIKGLGALAGMDIINVDGATGLYDTNYEGKADACIEALKDHDLVYVHVEAPDEAGHEGNYTLKKKTIEDLDKRLVARILDNLNKIDDKIKIAVLPDHPTPIELKTHTKEPVPFLITTIGENAPDTTETLDEQSAKNGAYGKLEGAQFLKTLLSENQ